MNKLYFYININIIIKGVDILKDFLGSLELNRIYQMDCIEGMQLLPDESIDLVITSPPYAQQRSSSYGGIDADGYPSWFLSITREVMRVLKPTGSFVFNIKEHASNGVRSTYVYETVLLLSKDYRFVDEFIWHKTNPFPTGSKKRLKDGFERCYHFTKSKDYKFFPNNVLVKSESKWLESEKRRKNKGAHYTKNGSGMNMSRRYVSEYVRPSNVITSPTSNINIGHPAVFPITIPEFFIKLMSSEGDIILDPFIGSGTTAVACELNNRKWIGFEIVPEYIEIANKRLEKIKLHNDLNDYKYNIHN